MAEEDEKRWRREGKKRRMFTASVNQRFTERCAARWQRKNKKNQSKGEIHSKVSYQEIRKLWFDPCKMANFSQNRKTQRPHTQPHTHIASHAHYVVLAEAEDARLVTCQILIRMWRLSLASGLREREKSAPWLKIEITDHCEKSKFNRHKEKLHLS